MNDETKTATAETNPHVFEAPSPANLASKAPQADPFADTMWTQDRIDLIKAEICPAGIGDGEFRLFLEKCKRSGLDPLMGEAYCVPRSQKVKFPDPKGRKEQDGRPVMLEHYVERHVFQASEQGMQVRAHRAGDFDGVRFGAIYANDKCAIDFSEGKVVHQAMAGQPRGALIGAWAIARRKGRDFHPVAHVLFSEYRQKGAMWDGKPETMIGKCARSLALRLAYPYEFAGVFTAEEMGAGIDRDATPADNEAMDRTPIDGPTQSGTGAEKTDDLEAFLKSRTPAAKAPIVTPAPKPSAATVDAPKATAAPAAGKATPAAAPVPPKVEPQKTADVHNFPGGEKREAPAAAPAAAKGSPGPDEIKVGTILKKIVDATVAELETQAAFAIDQMAKSPTATWVPRVKEKLVLVEAELKARADALKASLEAPEPEGPPAHEGSAEDPEPQPGDTSPPEPGTDG